MRLRKTMFKVFMAAIFLFTGLVLGANANPHVQFPPSEGVKASPEAVKEIEAFYAKLEDALIKKDVDAMMTFYSKDYFHQGITKQQINNLWSNIFSKFDKLNSIHIFSDINVQGNEAAIVCTGTLLGIPKGSKDGKYVSIDKWVNQNHFLSKKEGSWQIVGGASHWLSETTVRPGGVIEYQLEFHPLF